MKKHKTLLIIILIFFSSCEIDRTQRMWSNKLRYEDNINSFLIGQDGKKIAFIGEKYHYLLNDDLEILKNLLSWSGRSKLITQTSNFKVGLTNSVQLDIRIYTLYTKFSPQEIEFLQKLKFSENNGRFSKDIILNGKRYLPKPEVNYNAPLSFNRKIPVTISYTSYM